LVGEKAGKKVQTGLSLYQPAEDKEQVVIYSPDWKSDPYEYITGASGTEWLKLQHKPVKDTVLGGLEIFVKDKIYPKGSGTGLSTMTANAAGADQYKNLVITAVASADMPVKVIFITADAVAYSTTVMVGKAQKQISIPLNSLQKDVAVLLPRPYPGFQAMTFSAPHTNPFQINQVEKIQLLLKGDAKQEFSIEIGNVRLDNQ
jgi:hypothetical protein